MLFSTPELDDQELKVVSLVEDLKSTLRTRLQEPHRWSGSLRRMQFARAVNGSNSIEGFDASLDDMAAIDLGEPPIDADEGTRRVLKGYRDAMTYVSQLASDDDFVYTGQLLKSLHFIMGSFDFKDRLGRWRTGANYVRRGGSDEVVYSGPDIIDVPMLMSEFVGSLHSIDASPAVIRAAMAHLNLVMIQPFADGNGRVARSLQTLVLARQGTLPPAVTGIEEYLGRHRQAYFDVLAQVGTPSWQPEGDARPWIRFVLTAHLRQAQTLNRRVGEIELLWDRLEKLVATRGLPERSVSVLFDASMGLRVRNVTYRAALSEASNEVITEATASRDLRQLVEGGLLETVGEKRARLYLATKELQELRDSIRAERPKGEKVDLFAKLDRGK